MGSVRSCLFLRRLCPLHCCLLLADADDVLASCGFLVVIVRLHVAILGSLRSTHAATVADQGSVPHEILGEDDLPYAAGPHVADVDRPDVAVVDRSDAADVDGQRNAADVSPDFRVGVGLGGFDLDAAHDCGTLPPGGNGYSRHSAAEHPMSLPIRWKSSLSAGTTTNPFVRIVDSPNSNAESAVLSSWSLRLLEMKVVVFLKAQLRSHVGDIV